MQKLILFLTTFLAAFVLLNPLSSREERIVYFDIGQGDSALIQLGEFEILIDGGSSDEIIYKLSKYLPPTDREIEVVVLTHPHADHLSGLLDVQERYTVGWYIDYPVEYSTPGYEEFLRDSDWLSCDHWLRDNVVRGEQKLSCTSRRVQVQNLPVGLEVYIYYPILTNETHSLYQPEKAISQRNCDMKSNGDTELFPPRPNINNDSVVVLLEYKGESYLFMGDAEREEEGVLLHLLDKASGGFSEQPTFFRELNESNSVRVLKAGHHCSNTSSTKRFIKTVNPQFIVCSVGKDNKFGHPHKRTTDLFEGLGIPYAVTWQSGDIVVGL